VPNTDPVGHAARRDHPRGQKWIEKAKCFHYTAWAFRAESAECAQVAQAVERSPEKAGVGGSTPSLGTICSSPFCSDSPLHTNSVCRFVVANLIFVLESQTNVVQSIQQAVAAKLINVEFKAQSVIRADAFLSQIHG
jgi:hypothetical protein